MSRQAADQAASARALTRGRSGLMSERWRRRLLVGRGDVTPPERVLVLERDLVEAALRRRPRPGVLGEEAPVGLALGEALGELRGLVVDRADAEAEAERLRLVADTRL